MIIRFHSFSRLTYITSSSESYHVSPSETPAVGAVAETNDLSANVSKATSTVEAGKPSPPAYVINVDGVPAPIVATLADAPPLFQTN